ncbi:PAS protein [Pseudomonas syringae pv. apii]|nr:PAS protein [Pseudomonas syringae pv. apii]
MGVELVHRHWRFDVQRNAPVVALIHQRNETPHAIVVGRQLRQFTIPRRDLLHTIFGASGNLRLALHSAQNRHFAEQDHRKSIAQRDKVHRRQRLLTQVAIAAPHRRVGMLNHIDAAITEHDLGVVHRLAGTQGFEYPLQGTRLTRLGHPIALVQLAGVQAMVFTAVHRHDLHVFLDSRNGGQEALTVVAVAVQLVRWLVGGANQHHALLEHHLQQAAEDHRITDVGHEQLVETHHPHVPRQLFGDHGQRLGRAHQFEHALVDPAHEVMKMLTPCRHIEAFEKTVHQPGLAAPDRAPQVHALRLAARLGQRQVTRLQLLHGLQLRLIGLKTTLDRTFISIQRRDGIHQAHTFGSGNDSQPTQDRAWAHGSSVLHARALEQTLAALGQVHHPQMLARLGVALTQGFQRSNRRVIDKAQVATVQCHLRRVFRGVELVKKRRGRGEEQRAVQVVDLTAVCLDMAVGVQLAGLLPGEVDGGDDDAEHHSGGQIGQHCNHRHRDDRQHVVDRHLAQHAQRCPGEGLLRDHEHHTHQRCQRNALDQRRQKQHEHQDHQARDHAGNPTAPARTEVDDRLADHRATAHATESTGHHVGSAQRHTLAVRVATCFSDLVGEVQGQQGFQQADQRHQDRVRRNDTQGVEVPRDVRQSKYRQAASDVRHVAQGAGRQAEQVHRQPDTEDRHQRRWCNAGDAWQQINDCHGQRHQAEHHVQRRTAEPRFADLEMLQLRHRNHNGQAVDEAEHHRIRHQPHQLAQPQQPEQNHDQAAEQHGRQQVLHALLHHQRHDHHRHRTGRT